MNRAAVKTYTSEQMFVEVELDVFAVLLNGTQDLQEIRPLSCRVAGPAEMLPLRLPP